MFTLVKKNPFCCGGLAPMLLFVALVLSAMVFSCRLEAQAAGQEVGLVTGVSGDVTYENESDQEEPANVQAFMKIRKGDRFKVHTGGMIQLVYFSNGRQETWKGHLTLVAGDGETKVRKNEADVQPEVKTLPTTVAQALGSSSMPLPRSVPTSGAVQIRGVNGKSSGASKAPAALSEKEKQDIAAAETASRGLREGRDPGDVTPELYLLSVLADYGQYAEMTKVIDAALQRQPGNAGLLQLKDWAASRK